MRRAGYKLMGVVSVLAASCLMAGGCGQKKPAPPVVVYTGPLLSTAELLRGINKRADGTKSVWARHSFSLTARDKKGRVMDVSGDGVLMYQRSASSPVGAKLRLVGNKDLAGNIFEMGSDDTRYWFSVTPEVSTMWWGKLANRDLPCTEGLPVRPDEVLSVLGLALAEVDPTREPAPVVTYREQPAAYEVLWSAATPAGRRPIRRVMYDRQTLRPMAVTLFEADGRVAVTATLSNYPVSGGAVSAGAVDVAGSMTIQFPSRGATLQLQLRDVVSSRNGIPNERSIVFPSEPRVEHVLQVDEGCD